MYSTSERNMFDDTEEFKYPFEIFPEAEDESEPKPPPKPIPEKTNSLVESHTVRSLVRKIYYRYIQRPFQEIKDRWFSYFAEITPSEDSPPENELDDKSSVHALKTTGSSTAPPRASDNSLVGSDIVPPPRSSSAPISIPKRQSQSLTNPVSHFKFFTSALGATFGLGQLWRFPFMAYKSGGAAFVIVYSVFTLLFGYPLFFMEIAHGQYSSQNILRGFNMVPFLRGVGFSMVAYSYVTIIYHIQMVGFGMKYFGESFNTILPWSNCSEPYSRLNNSVCYPRREDGNYMVKPFQCSEWTEMFDVYEFCNDKSVMDKVIPYCCRHNTYCPTRLKNECKYKRDLPSEFYWRKEFYTPLSESPEVHGYLGDINLKLLLGLFTAWSLVYLINSIGFKCYGVFVLVTVNGLLFAFISMIGLMSKSPGFVEGISHFFIPNETSFMSTQLWVNALQQCFYSLGIGMGSLTSLGSISHFRTQCHIDALIITVFVLVGGLLSGTTAFIGLSNMGTAAKSKFFEIQTFGPELALIAYSHITAAFPISWLSSSIFFLLYVLAGIFAMNGLLTGIALPIADLTKLSLENTYILKFIIVLSCFFLGIPFIMNGGMYYFEALDRFASGIGLVLIVLFQVITIYLYGLGRFCEDIAFMTGVYPSRFFRYMMMFLPILLIPAIIIYDFAMPPSTWYLKVTAYGTLGFVISPIVLFMLGQLSRRPRESDWTYMVDHAEKYGPKSEDLKNERRRFTTKRRIL